MGFTSNNNVQLQLNDNIKLEDLLFLDDVEVDPNKVANKENNNSSVDQQCHPGSTQPVDSLYFGTDPSNNSTEPDAESFASLAIASSDLNASPSGLPPVDGPIPDLIPFARNTNTAYQTPDDQINWSIAQRQRISTQNYDDPTEMNFGFFYNAPNYVESNNFVQQQPPPVTQPEPSNYPELQFLPSSNKNTLVLCKKEDIATKQLLATNSLVEAAPILHQSENPTSIRSSPGFPNFINQPDANTWQSIPMLRRPERIVPALSPIQPTHRMGNFGQNVRLEPRIPAIAVSPRAPYRQIVPELKIDPPKANTKAEAPVQNNPKLLLTTTTRNVADELLQHKNKQPLHKPCSCSKSQCLKLYCECFLDSVFCQESCKCINCFNNFAHEEERSVVVKSTLERNPYAFASKIGKLKGQHKLGCKCIRSNCLKNYCECYHANIPCSSNCKCWECKNMPTEEDLKKGEPMEVDDDSPDPNEGNTSNSSNSDVPKNANKPTQLTDFLTDDVMNPIYDAILLKGSQYPANSNEGLIKGMQEFSSCFQEILEAFEQATAKENEKKSKVRNPKKKAKKEE